MYTQYLHHDCNPISFTDDEINKEEEKPSKYNNIDFITLTNTGYIDYTLNCLRSLQNINLDDKLRIYCIGEEGGLRLKENGYDCEFIYNDDSNTENFHLFHANNYWLIITFYKFEIIYKHLLTNKYVCLKDGDIVYKNDKIFDFLLDNIEDNDMLIQSEGLHTEELCSGFMFIKSNETTLSLFNPSNVKQTINMPYWDDQKYVNSIKHNLKFKKLPLDLFPTGNHYYNFNDVITQPYLIHFNWVVGHEKKMRMKKYNKWYICD